MKYILICLFILQSLFVFADDKKTILVDNLKRSYYIHKPKTLKAGRKYPLVIVLHGGGQSAKDMISFTGFNTYADKDSFIVVYPNGEDNHWNDGRIIPEINVKNVDDVKFISQLIDELATKEQADNERVFITGIANGGMMCYRLACELSNKILAIGPVLGSIPSDIMPSCKPTKVVHIVAINGSEDPVVPFTGGDITFDNVKIGKVESVPNTLNFFANYGSELKATAFKVKRKDLDHTDHTTVITENYTNNKYEADILLYNIKGGGHAWPGATQFLPPSITGNVSREMDASQAIWEFFTNINLLF